MFVKGNIQKGLKKVSVCVLIGLVSLTQPVFVFAQEVTNAVGDTTGAPPVTGAPDNTGAPDSTGAPPDTGTPIEETGAPACTGAGCGQGAGQGTNQGINQGGRQPEDVGGVQDEEGNWTFPDGGQQQLQGGSQGTTNGIAIDAGNTGTGSNSNNTADVDATRTTSNSITNVANDRTQADADATTGQNEASMNTGNAGITTGNAGIGVTQIKNDNTATVNGTAGVTVGGYGGNYEGDLALAFNELQSLFTSDGQSQSIRAINDTTGQDSTNSTDINTVFEDVTEVQNDGVITNELDLTAITGQNTADKNTGGGTVATGDANVAATLVNLLNSTVINGSLLIAVQDIFGDLTGNISIPLLSQLQALYGGGFSTSIDASNDTTGSDSTNSIDIDLEKNDNTTITNNADISTTVNAQAITGQNDTLANTGGGEIDTGDASVSASNVSVANTTVQGGAWALVIVNALNRWVGLLLGDNGEVRQLSQDETIREIEARNSNTGENSDNTIDITSEENRTTNLTNDARIANTVTAKAITGQNSASYNTGKGDIDTGKATVEATTVNIANTVVKDATLAIAVVNVFGDWIGDLLYGGSSLLAGLFGNGASSVAVDASNTKTGSTSDNTIDVSVDQNTTTDIDNTSDIRTTLNATVDTGNNRSSRNTTGADIETGRGFLDLHTRNIANVTAISGEHGIDVTVRGENSDTGFDSRNSINARMNESWIIDVDNEARVLSDFTAEVNTGNNEANQNTVGGVIDTGDIDASVMVDNMINKVMLALGSDVAYRSLTPAAQGALVSVMTDLLNSVTGEKSDNRSIVEVIRDALVSILNEGVAQTVADLLLNTGGNEANENTCGIGCVTQASAAEQPASLPDMPSSGTGDSEQTESSSAGEDGESNYIPADEDTITVNDDGPPSQDITRQRIASTIHTQSKPQRSGSYIPKTGSLLSQASVGQNNVSSSEPIEENNTPSQATGVPDVSKLLTGASSPLNSFSFGLTVFFIGSIVAAGAGALARKWHV